MDLRLVCFCAPRRQQRSFRLIHRVGKCCRRGACGNMHRHRAVFVRPLMNFRAGLPVVFHFTSARTAQHGWIHPSHTQNSCEDYRLQFLLYRTESTVVLVTMESVKKSLYLLFLAGFCIHFYVCYR